MKSLSYIIALYVLAVASLSYSLPSLDIFIGNNDIKVISKGIKNNDCAHNEQRKVLYLNLEDKECINLEAGSYELYQNQSSSRLLFKFDEPVVICKQGGFYNIFYAKNYVLFMSLTVQ